MMTLDQYLEDRTMEIDEQERLEEERGRKLEALFSECEEMLLDINKEYRDLDAITMKKFTEMFV